MHAWRVLSKRQSTDTFHKERVVHDELLRRLKTGGSQNGKSAVALRSILFAQPTRHDNTSVLDLASQPSQVLWQKLTELGEIDDFYEHHKEIVAFLGAHSGALPLLGGWGIGPLVATPNAPRLTDRTNRTCILQPHRQDNGSHFGSQCTIL